MRISWICIVNNNINNINNSNNVNITSSCHDIIEKKETNEKACKEIVAKYCSDGLNVKFTLSTKDGKFYSIPVVDTTSVNPDKIITMFTDLEYPARVAFYILKNLVSEESLDSVILQEFQNVIKIQELNDLLYKNVVKYTTLADILQGKKEDITNNSETKFAKLHSKQISTKLYKCSVM